MAGPTNNTKVLISSQMVEDMQEYRLAQLEHEIPVKTRRDFESDEAYKNYLLDSYSSLRQTEYKYVVRNETMKVYNLACDGNKATGLNDNMQVWDGYKRYVNSAKTQEEKKKRQQQVNDCAMSRAQRMGGMCMLNNPAGVKPQSRLHCCAITSSVVTAQISGKMGYDGENNLVKAKYRGANPGKRNNIIGAAYISQADSIQNQMRVVPEMKPQPSKTQKQKTLNEMVRSGELGVGDSVALKMSDGGNNTTGSHAMVIADVIRDKDGKVTSYVLQANNNRCFRTVNVNDPFGKRKVVDVVKTHEWINAKIGQERENLKDLSIEELEARVVEQRGKTEAVIADLGKTEAYNVQKGYCLGYQSSYVAEHRAAMKYMTEGNSEEPISENIEDSRSDLQKAMAYDAEVAKQKLENVNPLSRDDLIKFMHNIQMIDPHMLAETYKEGENPFERQVSGQDEQNTNTAFINMLMQRQQGRA